MAHKIGKKGLSFYVIVFSFFRMAILMAVVFAIVLLVRQFISSSVDVSPAEAEILAHNVMLAISHTDPVTHRVYPGKISVDSFTNAELDKRMSSTRRGMACKVSIVDFDNMLVKYQERELEPIFLNRDDYLRWIVLAKARALGSGGVTEYIIWRNAVFMGEKAIVQISITIPNS
jgi:hypothetical protein